MIVILLAGATLFIIAAAISVILEVIQWIKKEDQDK